jgi:hypothetical protein
LKTEDVVNGTSIGTLLSRNEVLQHW